MISAAPFVEEDCEQNQDEKDDERSLGLVCLMPTYKKDKETGRMMVKLSFLDEWIDLENYIKELRDESKIKSKTFKEKLKDKAIKALKEI